MRATCLFCGTLESTPTPTSASPLACPTCGEQVYDADLAEHRLLIESAASLARGSAIRSDRPIQVWLGANVLALMSVGPGLYLLPPVLASVALVTAALVYRATHKRARPSTPMLDVGSSAPA